MNKRRAQINQIMAIAMQAQSIEERQTRQLENTMRAERQAAERYRHLATTSEQAFSAGFPMVGTIH